MDTKAIADAIHALIAQARGFAVPCVLIIIVTMGVILCWDLFRALVGASGGHKPRGPKHHQVW